MNGSDIIKKMHECLKADYHKDIKNATAIQVYNALSKSTMENLADDWISSIKSHNDGRRVCYFSAEFLVGRAIFNNLLCLGIYDDVKCLLSEQGFDIERLEEIEDAALGNGGLGRLAACFLDSAATLNLPVDGYGIRYKYGLFKQAIEGGFQVEYPDDWTKYGDPWAVRCEEDSVYVDFYDQKVVAVPYDMPIIGYGTNHVGTLRLWQAEAVNCFDFEAFNDCKYRDAVEERDAAEDISSVLYPNDNTIPGKVLRLKQQYFFCSASLQDIIKKYKKKCGNDFSKFADMHAIQLNDTHPVISIAELIRLLCDVEGLSFKEAFNIARKTFSYTNHTIMSEALEKWSKKFMKKVIPTVVKYILLIQDEFKKEMKSLGVSKAIVSKISILQGDTIHMANLAVYASTYTNGVARIHTDILKDDVLKEWYSIYPEKFQNKTNGITQRRWLLLCNRELSDLITRLLGSDKWITNLSELKKLEKFVSDENVINDFMKLKYEKRCQLAKYIKNQDGVSIDPDTIFDVQVKRLHEYKRQLLNILAILHLYFKIKDGKIKDFTPTTFIFGAKAAPGYDRAKGIIKLINTVADLIEKDKLVSKYIKVVFVQNYNVSYAEKIMAAADVSEQISTAGTEASGTGNMKFMLNGAVTLGTFDGANVEIVEEAGRENNYIFGNTVEQIKELSEDYDPVKIYNHDKDIKRVLDALDNGLLDDDNTGVFKELKDSILKGASWHDPDQYYLLADFKDYVDAKLKVNQDYKDRVEFAKKCWLNIANAGKFSSDRTIADYAENLWHIKEV